MLNVFNLTDQATLAACVWHMNLYRAELLGLTRPADAHVHRQPPDYVPLDPALRCAADHALTPLSRLLPRMYMYAIIMLLAAAFCLVYYAILIAVLDMRHKQAS
jgi:hypothetical protein